ncbi:tyrosine-protein phosphatase siw14 [Recurvomyces mirabilis]|nr:tyrosine-protein phosphatase siw14 [Recurvomyces mirabilis]
MEDRSATEVVQENQEAKALIARECQAVDEKQDTNVLEAMEGVEQGSRPPSPPSSGAATPTLRRLPCPDRLWPRYPPANYGAATRGTLFRSAYPADRNIEFLECLDIKSVLCLVDTEPSVLYSRWIEENNIKRHRVDIAPNKEGKPGTSGESLCEALLIVLDAENYPLHIHCNQGKHRTGCLIACLRKIQRRPMCDILLEYYTYAYPKARPGDVELIKAFDPEAVFDYAKAHGYLEKQSFMKRMDSMIVNVDGLAEALSSNAALDSGMSIASTWSAYSTSSSEHGLEMSGSGKIELLENDRPSLSRTSSQDSIITLSGVSGQSEDHDTAASDINSPSSSVVELAYEDMTPPPDTECKALGSQ